MLRDWKYELNGTRLAEALFDDPHKDGFQVKKWERTPRSTFDEIYLRGKGQCSLQGNTEWAFPQTDRGAVTFQVKNSPDQLMIDLCGYQSDALYYTIVIGRGKFAGVLRKVMSGQPLDMFHSAFPRYTYVPLQGVEYDNSFYLDDGPVDLWMIYDYGHMWVGVGCVPGEGHVILHAFDARASAGCQLFQFGVWANSDDRTTTIHNVYPWRKHGEGRAVQSPFVL